MIFKRTWLKVVDGTKTQTRRLVKPGEKLIQMEHFSGGYSPLYVENAKYKRVYTVGTYFAVQPDRGRVALARAFLTDIRREDVRQISGMDVKAEGFDSRYDFLELWTKLHDKEAYRRTVANDIDGNYIEAKPYEDYLATRPAERYQAWALTFHLARDRK